MRGSYAQIDMEPSTTPISLGIISNFSYNITPQELLDFEHGSRDHICGCVPGLGPRMIYLSYQQEAIAGTSESPNLKQPLNIHRPLGHSSI